MDSTKAVGGIGYKRAVGLGRKLHQCPLLTVENPERGENDETIHNVQWRMSNLLEPNFE